MNRARPLSLAELRRCVAALRDPRELARWEERLRDDGRAGAAELAGRLARRRERARREQERLGRLLALRATLRARGARWVAGVDEAGMGPLAGPVVAAAVILGDDPDLPGLDDSKRLSARQRERLALWIRAQAVAVGLGEASPAEVDRWNVYRAGLEAMRRAVAALGRRPDHVLVDARTIPALGIAQTALVRGDSRDGSIAAASILAKVHRDGIMERLDRAHPGYGFARHKGYPTPEHLRALRQLGPSPVHRSSFAPVARVAGP